MKKYFLIFFASFLLSLLVMPLRGGYVEIAGLSGQLSMLVGFMAFFALTAYLLRRYNGIVPAGTTILLILLGQNILTIPVHIIEWRSTLGALPDTLIHIFGVICGFGFWRLRSWLSKVLMIVLPLAGVLWYCYVGDDYWSYKLYYGSFTGRVERQIEGPLMARLLNGADSVNVDVNLRELPYDYLIIDIKPQCDRYYSGISDVRKEFAAYGNVWVGTVQLPCEHTLHWDSNRGVWSEDKDLCKPTFGLEGVGGGEDYPLLYMELSNPALGQMLFPTLYGHENFQSVVVLDKYRNMIYRGNNGKVAGLSIDGVVKFMRKTLKKIKIG